LHRTTIGPVPANGESGRAVPPWRPASNRWFTRADHWRLAVRARGMIEVPSTCEGNELPLTPRLYAAAG